MADVTRVLGAYYDASRIVQVVSCAIRGARTSFWSHDLNNLVSDLCRVLLDQQLAALDQCLKDAAPSPTATDVIRTAREVVANQCYIIGAIGDRIGGGDEQPQDRLEALLAGADIALAQAYQDIRRCGVSTDQFEHEADAAGEPVLQEA